MDQAALEDLKKSPAFQAGVKEADEEEMPAGEISGGGRVYTNPTLGFSIRVPEPLSAWTLSGEPSGKMFLLMISPKQQSAAAQISAPAKEPSPMAATERAV
jgi:hypothetical protein